MNENEIVWEDPGAIPPRSGKLWLERLAPLMDHPGQWARVEEFSHASAWQVARHLRLGIKQPPPGRWEFAARTNKDNTSRSFLYARYLGPEDGV